MNKAVCIGINDYPGYASDLSGCVNDATDWADFLASRGYGAVVVTDAAATRSGIVAAMTALVTGLAAGETGVITFSGHGTWLPDFTGDEPDLKDEALCPYDMSETNLILDDDIQRIIAARPEGTRVTLVTDCCHSGTLHRALVPAITMSTGRRARYIPPDAFVTDAATRAAMALVGNYRPPVKTDAALPGVVHFSGCSDREYSYDAFFGTRANGAYTYAAMNALRTNPDATSADLYKAVRRVLPSHDNPQTPRLNCPPDLKKRPAFPT